MFGPMPVILQVNILRPLGGDFSNTDSSAGDTQSVILARGQAVAVYLFLSLLSATQIPQDPLRCAPILIGSLSQAHSLQLYGWDKILRKFKKNLGDFCHFGQVFQKPVVSFPLAC